MRLDRTRLAPRPLGLVTFALAAVLAAVILDIRFSTYINHDTAWYLYSAERLLDGGRLYQDIFVDPNPPLGLYLTVPAVYLSRLTGVFSADLYVAFLGGLLLVSLTVVWRLLRRIPGWRPVQLAIWLLAVYFALLVLPAADFGQREHVMLILAFPYLTLVALRVSDGKCHIALAILVGIAAGLGFGLKPHFLLVPTLLELYLLFRFRRIGFVFRPENVALGGTLLLYLAVIFLFTPEYVTRVVPLALEVYNTGYQQPLTDVLYRLEVLVLPIVLLLFLSRRPPPEIAVMGDVLCLSALCFLVVYAVQSKGWSYQAYPASACLLLVVVVSIMTNFAARPDRHDEPRRYLSRLAIQFLQVSLVAALSARALFGMVYVNPFADLMSPIVRERDDHTGIYLFTSYVSSGFPLVLYSSMKWCSRFPTLWLLPGVQNRLKTDDAEVPSESRRRLSEVERYVSTATLEDFMDCAPELVIVDIREQPRYFDRPFNFVDYFTSNSDFARIWNTYVSIGEVSFFQIYQRTSAGRAKP